MRLHLRFVHTSGALRVIYVAKFANTVYVLHAFQKKAQKTTKAVFDLAAARYKLIEALSHEQKN